MMAVFGTEEWSRNGETFSVYFNMFSQLSVFEVRDGEIGRRRLFSGAARWATVPGSIAVVIASIATTSFDGAQEGVLKDAINSSFNRLVDAGVGLVTALRLDQSIYMALCIVAVSALYLLGVQGMRTIRNAPAAARLRQGFAHTLIPIAFAYLVAHYFSLFVFQEQAQFTYLLSDPLGVGLERLRNRGQRDRLRDHQLERDLVRPGRGTGDRPRLRADDGPRPGNRLLEGLSAGIPLAALDARRDGRVHLLRPLSALAGESMTAALDPKRLQRGSGY